MMPKNDTMALIMALMMLPIPEITAMMALPMVWKTLLMQLTTAPMFADSRVVVLRFG